MSAVNLTQPDSIQDFEYTHTFPAESINYEFNISAADCSFIDIKYEFTFETDDESNRNPASYFNINKNQKLIEWFSPKVLPETSI